MPRPSHLFSAATHPRDHALAPYLADFDRVVSDLDFPCMFATQALARDELLFGFGDVAEEGIDAATTLMDLAVEAIWEDPDQVVVLWLGGIESQSLDDDHEVLRTILRRLLVVGGSEWPADAPTDPSDPGWNFWYKGVDFFINVSTRHHEKRRSRNLGQCFTLVVQSRASFDRLPRGARVARSRIRGRIADYDALGVSPLLGTHGAEPELPQFFLGDTNTCPYIPIGSSDVDAHAYTG